MALNIENIVSELETATILELSELVKAIEEKFDVSAAAPVAVAGPLLPVATLVLLKNKLNSLLN